MLRACSLSGISVWPGRITLATAYCGALLFGGLAAAEAGEFVSSPLSPVEHWYTTEQVAAGEAVFRENCLECHGERAAGKAVDWRKPDAEGKFPPPPLNGTAHAWHHPKQILFDTVTAGGAPLGGWMPAFGGKLSKEEILAAIAYLQHLWPDSVYADWEEVETESEEEIDDLFGSQ
ncbi:MAG: cytochrome c [Pseudomonadota bacterium]|nr:cytochrome c [Pseudomonadota bacterium]